jgi:hypothetical protein
MRIVSFSVNYAWIRCDRGQRGSLVALVYGHQRHCFLIVEYRPLKVFLLLNKCPWTEFVLVVLFHYKFLFFKIFNRRAPVFIVTDVFV